MFLVFTVYGLPKLRFPALLGPYIHIVKLAHQLIHMNSYFSLHTSLHSDEVHFCIVMEHCGGGDLASMIRKKKEEGSLLPELHVMDWTIQIILAIKHVHDRNILHRDLKPAVSM